MSVTTYLLTTSLSYLTTVMCYSDFIKRIQQEGYVLVRKRTLKEKLMLSKKTLLKVSMPVYNIYHVASLILMDEHTHQEMLEEKLKSGLIKKEKKQVIGKVDSSPIRLSPEDFRHLSHSEKLEKLMERKIRLQELREDINEIHNPKLKKVKK